MRFTTQTYGQHTDVTLDYHELHASLPSSVFKRDGKLWEYVQGMYYPRRLHFIGPQIIKGAELGFAFADLPADHPTRALTSALAWRTPTGENYYLLGVHMEAHPALLLVAQRCIAQDRPSPSQRVALTRDWSPPPLAPARLVPNAMRLYERYGGNSITVRLKGRIHHRRLLSVGWTSKACSAQTSMPYSM